MSTPSVDLLIIGGGVNGAAVARDAAGRGLKVMLAEKGDYAAATSSASSKLIHGGLRYLEQGEFGLVRESLAERARLLRAAPHLVQPLRFLVPIRQGATRPAWVVRAGLGLYDLLSLGHRIAPSGRLSADAVQAVPRLKRDGLKAILHYHDAQADDARLVLALILDARSRGADVRNRRTVAGLSTMPNGYRIVLDERGTRRTIDARFVVNAAGPWADQIDGLMGAPPARPLRLVRGSHVVVRMSEPATADAVTLQPDDGRVVFVLPWLDRRFLVIGTTDVPHDGAPDAARCSPEERDYLLATYNAHFDHPGGPLRPDHVVHTWSGVRALVNDGETRPSDVTRRANLHAQLNGAGGWITLQGGKLTTHRVLAEATLQGLRGFGAFIGGAWTADARLFGGSLDRAELRRHAEAGPGEVRAATRRRWAFTYGDRIEALFDRVRHDPRVAREIAPGLPEAELLHAVETEDALSAEDILLRRGKLHLSLTEPERARVADWMSGGADVRVPVGTAAQMTPR